MHDKNNSRRKLTVIIVMSRRIIVSMTITEPIKM